MKCCLGIIIKIVKSDCQLESLTKMLLRERYAEALTNMKEKYEQRLRSNHIVHEKLNT